MPNDTPFEIAVPILDRHRMETRSPSWYLWTYHHVLPLRLYYVMASAMLRVAVHPDCWPRTRIFARDALASMCDHQDNAKAVARFVDRRAGTGVDDGAFEKVAKLCSSPWFGGFGGPRPEQRSDDPGGVEEPNKPLSMSQVGWAAIQRSRAILFEMFGIAAVPLSGSIAMQRPIGDWCRLVDALCIEFNVAKYNDYHIFEGSDWVYALAGERYWSEIGERYIDRTAGKRPPLRAFRLRRAGEIDRYFVARAPGWGGLKSTGAVYLGHDSKDRMLHPARSPL